MLVVDEVKGVRFEEDTSDIPNWTPSTSSPAVLLSGGAVLGTEVPIAGLCGW